MFLVRAKSYQVFGLVLITLICGAQLNKIDLQLAGTVVTVLAILVVYAWYLFLGLKLNKDLNGNFPWSFAISCSYVFFLIAISLLYQEPENETAFEDIPVYIFVVLAFYALTYIYMIYFTGKMLIKTLGENVLSNKFRGELSVYFLLLFLPIGIWVIQPLVNGEDNQ